MELFIYIVIGVCISISISEAIHYGAKTEHAGCLLSSVCFAALAAVNLYNLLER